MSLQSLRQFAADFDTQDSVQNDLISLPLFVTETNEQIGTVEDVLVADSGNFRYLVVRSDDRVFLVPVGICRAYSEQDAISIEGLSNRQDLDTLPPYDNNTQIDYDYEEQIRQVFRQLLAFDEARTASFERDSYSYDREPDLYQISGDENQTIKLYEEKLITNKQRHEVGEVTIGKRVETETAEAQIPVEKEKVVVKVNEVGDKEIPAEPGEAKFESGEVVKMKVYEETADIKKEAFVRQEVEVKKEVEKKVINAEETLRKEEIEMTGEENIEVQK